MTDIAEQVQVALLADPRDFIRRITYAARLDIGNYSGHVLRHIATVRDMPCAVDELMKTFFLKENPGTVIDYVLADTAFVRDWFPRYISEFAPYLRPGPRKSFRLEAMATVDREIRLACWPSSSFLLALEEWTSELATGSALGPTIAAIPAAFLTPELLHSFMAFDELCAIVNYPGVEREMVLEFLRTHANYLFSRFKTSRQRIKLLSLMNGHITPCNVTTVLRQTTFEDVRNTMDHISYSESHMWPWEKFEPTGRYSLRLSRFHRLLNELDWMVLPFFTKHDLNVNVMGHIASYLFVNDFASRVRVFFKQSPMLVAGYVERCITSKANVSKRRRKYYRKNDGIMY